MGPNIFLLNTGYNTKTTLDKAYSRHVNSILETLTEDQETRWEIYSIIIQQWIQQGKAEYYKELKYRLTDGENPNEILLDLINREGDDVDNLIWSLKKRVEDYLDEDILKRFCL